MSFPIKAAVVALAAFAAADAHAQLLGPSFEANIALSAEDMQMMRAVVTDQIHGKPVGATASWDNPRSGNSGTVRLLKKLMLGGRHCEELQYVLRTSQRLVPPEHYVFTSCLQPDGTWKIAQGDVYVIYG